MRTLKWTTSHAVFVAEIDDEHKEIFAAVSQLGEAFSHSQDTRELTKRLVASMVDHFAHEERLMRASRYSSMSWHKLQHDNARRRVAAFISRVEGGDMAAGPEMIDHLTGWLRDHTRLADRMMGAYLRNQMRCVKLTFRAGTKPIDACDWVDSKGGKFELRPAGKGF